MVVLFLVRNGFSISQVLNKVLFAYQRKALRRFFFNPIRMARLAAIYPNPLYLPKYSPMLIKQLLKGIFKG